MSQSPKSKLDLFSPLLKNLHRQRKGKGQLKRIAAKRKLGKK